MLSNSLCKDDDSYDVKRDDVIKQIFFIIALTQKLNTKVMQGALSSKGDFIGGIFDRWINIVPENIVFDKIILKKINSSYDLKVINDFYLYNPKTTGIAPDVFGIYNQNKNLVFVKSQNNQWVPIKNTPQIEVKTFKEQQYMISLRDQSYKDKYLVLTLFNLKIDYLLAFFDKNLFKSINKDELYKGQDQIIQNSCDEIHTIDNIDFSNDTIGTVKLLKITKANSFMNIATLCEENVSVQYIKDIIEQNKSSKTNLNQPLSLYVEKTKDIKNLNIKNQDDIPDGFYTFTREFYDGFDDNHIPYHKIKHNKSERIFLYRTLDFYTSNIDDIKVVSKSHTTMNIQVKNIVLFNEYTLLPNKIYKINFQILDRSGSKNQEYFFQKSLISYINDYKEDLINKFKALLNDNN